MHIGERVKALKLKMLFVDNIKKCNGTSMVFNLSLSLCVCVSVCEVLLGPSISSVLRLY